MIVAALKSQAGTKPSSSGVKTPPRGRSESPRPPPFKYPDNECMECGATTHRRADCPIFKKVLAANGGQWPKGHKGKFEKARDAHQKKHGRGSSRGRLHSSERYKKKTTHVKQLDASNESSSDPGLVDSSDSEGDNPTLAASVVSRRAPQTGVFSLVTKAHSCKPSKTKLCNSYSNCCGGMFEPLKDDLVIDNDDSDSDGSDAERIEMAKALSSWTRKVNVRRSTKKKGKQIEGKVCSTETELDDYLKANPTIIAALPEDRKSLAKLAKRCPSDEMLGEGEVYMMMDSGAGCNGGKCKELFPKYRVQKHSKTRPQQNVVSACGTKLPHRGHVNLNVEIGGEDHKIPMDDIDVDLPILSVRRIVRQGNPVNFRQGGGYIRNARTGTKLRFVERQGVYFIKVKVKEPSPEDALEQSFTRPGR